MNMKFHALTSLELFLYDDTTILLPIHQQYQHTSAAFEHWSGLYAAQLGSQLSADKAAAVNSKSR